MIEKIREAIEPVFQEEQTEIVDIVFKVEAGKHVLRILADKEGGIRLSDCAKLNGKISQILEEKDIIQESYVIEVHSPGIDRQFKTKRDYERAIGRLVRVTLNERIMDKMEYIARLEEVSDIGVKIEVKKKGIIEIPFEKIVRAREEIEF